MRSTAYDLQHSIYKVDAAIAHRRPANVLHSETLSAMSGLASRAVYRAEPKVHLSLSVGMEEYEKENVANMHCTVPNECHYSLNSLNASGQWYRVARRVNCGPRLQTSATGVHSATGAIRILLIICVRTFFI